MNPWKGLAGLPRPVWIVFAATLINRAGTMVLPFLVLYLTRHLGFSAGQAALAVTAYGAGSMITGPLAGRLSDRIGPMAILEGSMFVSGLIVMLIPLAPGYVSILALVFFWALTADAFRPASMSHLTAIAGEGRSKVAVSVLRLAINLGMSVGPALGGFIAMWSFTALFIVDGCTSILAGLVLAFSRVRAARGAGREPAAPSPQAHRGSILGDASLVYFLLAMLPVVMVFFQIQAALPIHLVHNLRMPEAAYGLVFTLNTVLVIVLELPLSSVMAAWPHRGTLALGAMLVATGFGLTGLVSGYGGLAVSVVIWTLGEIVLLPTCFTYVAEIAPPARRGEYMGLYTTSISLAFTAGPWLGAAVLDRFGPAALWSGAFATGSLSAALLARARAGQREESTPPAADLLL